MLTARLLRPLLAVASLTGLMIYAAAPAGSAATAPGGRGQAVHTHPAIFVSGASTTGSTSHSNNWAGYAALPEHAGGRFRFVQATFTVPSVNCTATPNAFSVHWVGLDGFATSTVQQDGIEANCNGIAPVYWLGGRPIRLIRSIRSRRSASAPVDAVTAAVYYNAASGPHHDVWLTSS
jgi:hypothetical protein